jgi:hypothetical protein
MHFMTGLRRIYRENTKFFAFFVFAPALLNLISGLTGVISCFRDSIFVAPLSADPG